MKFEQRFEYADKIMSVVKKILKGAELKSIPTSIMNRVSYESDYPFLAELMSYPTIYFHSNENYGFVTVRYGIVYRVVLPNDGRSSKFVVFAENPFKNQDMRTYSSDGELSIFLEWIKRNELHTELNELQYYCKFEFNSIINKEKKRQQFISAVNATINDMFFQPNDAEEVIVNAVKHQNSILGQLLSEGNYVPFTKVSNTPKVSIRGLLLIAAPYVIKLYVMRASAAPSNIILEVNDTTTETISQYEIDNMPAIKKIGENIIGDKFAYDTMQKLKAKYQVELAKHEEDNERYSEIFKDYVYLVQQNFDNITINPFSLIITHENIGYKIERTSNPDVYEFSNSDTEKVIGTFDNIEKLEEILKDIFWNKSFVSRIKALI